MNELEAFMDSIFYKFLLSHGVTNIIDIDGLLYAAIGDLRSFANTCLVCGFVTCLLTLWFADGLAILIRSLYHRWKQRQN